MPQIALFVASDHPAFAGHFPGRPIVPGVVLLDLVQRAIEADCDVLDRAERSQIPPAAVGPGEALQLDTSERCQCARFEIRLANTRLPTAVSASPAAAGDGRTESRPARQLPAWMQRGARQYLLAEHHDPAVAAGSGAPVRVRAVRHRALFRGVCARRWRRIAGLSDTLPRPTAIGLIVTAMCWLLPAPCA